MSFKRRQAPFMSTGCSTSQKKQGEMFTSLEWRRRRWGKLKALSPANSFWLLLLLVCLGKKKNNTIMDNFQLPPTSAFQSLRAVIAAWLLFSSENSSWMLSHEGLNWSETEELTDLVLWKGCVPSIQFTKTVSGLGIQWAVTVTVEKMDSWWTDKQQAQHLVLRWPKTIASQIRFVTFRLIHRAAQKFH